MAHRSFCGQRENSTSRYKTPRSSGKFRGAWESSTRLSKIPRAVGKLCEALEDSAARYKVLEAKGKFYGAFLSSVAGGKILWLVNEIGLPPEIPGWERRHPRAVAEIPRALLEALR